MANNKNKFTAQQLIDAMPGSGGIIANIARYIGGDWNTVKKYIETMPTVKAAYDAEVESLLDLAESNIVQSLKLGDISTSKWYLSQKAKKRGYGPQPIDSEAPEQGVKKITLEWKDGDLEKLSDEKLRQIIED